MKPSIRRGVGKLGGALAALGVCASDAHAEGLGRAPAPAGGRVVVCVDLLRTPRAQCRRDVGVMIGRDHLPAIPDFSRHAVTERNLILAIERGIGALAERRRVAARPAMLYGIELEPVFQLRLRREMLVVLARLTEQGAIGRAAAGLRPSQTIRAFVEGEALERTRDRATYLQIEDFKGSNPLRTPLTTQGAFAALGASFFGSGIAAQRLLRGALGDALVIHPQPWPPGIEIGGTFGVP